MKSYKQASSWPGQPCCLKPWRWFCTLLNTSTTVGSHFSNLIPSLRIQRKKNCYSLNWSQSLNCYWSWRSTAHQHQPLSCHLLYTQKQRNNKDTLNAWWTITDSLRNVYTQQNFLFTFSLMSISQSFNINPLSVKEKCFKTLDIITCLNILHKNNTVLFYHFLQFKPIAPKVTAWQKKYSHYSKYQGLW